MHLGVLKRVFVHPRYAFFFIMVAFVVSSAAILLPQWGIIMQVAATGVFSFVELIAFVVTLYLSFGANDSLLSSGLIAGLSLLFALDVTLMTYYIRRRQLVLGDRKAHLVGVGGVVSSVLGIGCAACGSIILTAFFGVFGGAWLLVLLPFHGAEFGFLGVLLLLATMIYLMRRIDDPLVCPLES